MYGVSKINIETDLMMISVQDVAFRGTSGFLPPNIRKKNALHY